MQAFTKIIRVNYILLCIRKERNAVTVMRLYRLQCIDTTTAFMTVLNFLLSTRCPIIFMSSIIIENVGVVEGIVSYNVRIQCRSFKFDMTTEAHSHV